MPPKSQSEAPIVTEWERPSRRWIEKARVLSRSDLAQEVCKIKGKLPKHDPGKLLSETIAEFYDEVYPQKQDDEKTYKIISDAIMKWEEWKKDV